MNSRNSRRNISKHSFHLRQLPLFAPSPKAAACKRRRPTSFVQFIALCLCGWVCMSWFLCFADNWDIEWLIHPYSSRPYKTKVCSSSSVTMSWNHDEKTISGHCLMPECWAIGCRYLQALRPFGGPIWRIWRVWYTNIMWWRIYYDMTKYDTMRYHMMYGQHWTAPSFHGIPFSSFSAEPEIFFPHQMALDVLCIDITCSMECCANGWRRTLVSSTRTDLDWSFLVCGLIMLNCHTSNAEFWAFMRFTLW